MSFMAETATIAIKILRSSAVRRTSAGCSPSIFSLLSKSPHVRYHALTMLRKTLVSAKKALSDSLAKDIIKQMKNGLTDKALPVQRAAAAVRSLPVNRVLRTEMCAGLSDRVYSRRLRHACRCGVDHEYLR